jgi:hypothetical protein
MERMKIKFQKPFYEISHDAWLDDAQSPVTAKQESRHEDRGKALAFQGACTLWDQYSQRA